MQGSSRMIRSNGIVVVRRLRCFCRSGRVSSQQQRTYLGAAGEGLPILSPREQELFNTAKPRSDAIMAKHVSLPNLDAIPRHSFGNHRGGETPTITEADALEIRRKRLVYRCKQRGWLEVDLLLGTWASENVPTMSGAEMDEFEAFVNAETIDIYNIITLRVEVPDRFKTGREDGDGNSAGVVERIQQWAKNHPLGKADPEAYKKVKAEAKLI
jgi:succinate dehydrogenase assembly factor 2